MTDPEQSLVLIKPDGVSRGLIGEIISRFERRGLFIRQLKMMTISRDTAQQHYGEHEGKSFFLSLIDFITSGPVVALVIEGERAISIIRSMCGSTDAGLAAPGTIRGDFLSGTVETSFMPPIPYPVQIEKLNCFFNPEKIV